MNFTNCDPQNHQSENVWFTPEYFMKALGEFDMDVCTMSTRPFDIARVHIEHDKGFNSFDMNWEGCVWMNPPYGKEIAPFIEKFKTHNNGVALVFARMGTPWMQSWIDSGGKIFFLRKRICFVSKDGVAQKANAGTDSCLLIAGREGLKKVINSGLQGVLV